MTADEIIANGLHLCHFNPNHDPSNGRFTKTGLGRIVARHKQNKTRPDDYKRYSELSKRNPKSLTNDELEYVAKRKELEKKAKGKTPAKEAAEAEMARFAVKTIGTAAVIAAAVVGARYLKKKYNLSLESAGKKLVEGAGKFTSTVAKETANAVSDAVKNAMPTVKETAKGAAKSIEKAAGDILSTVGDKGNAALDAGVKAVKNSGAKAVAKAGSDAAAAVKKGVVNAPKNAEKVAGDVLETVGEKGNAALGAGIDAAAKAGKAIMKKFGLG